jgi:hypothetical protein
MGDIMAKPVLTIQRHYLDWPLGQSITNSELINQFGIRATSDGRDVTDKMTFNLTQVNINQQGEYPIVVTVMDSDGQTAADHLTLNVKPQSQVQSRTTTNAQPVAPKKSHRGWLVALIILIAIIVVWWAVAAHNRNQAQQANNTEQSSQISDNSSSINKLSSDNQKLAQQVAALRGAARQYEKDHDQQELQNHLNDISNQNQQIESQLNSNSAKQKLNDVNQVVNQLQQDPSNASSTVNSLKNKDGFSSIWNNITSMMESWLDNHSSSNNN